MRKIGLKKKFFSGKKFFFSIFFAEIYRENFCALYSRSENDKYGQKRQKRAKIGQIAHFRKNIFLTG